MNKEQLRKELEDVFWIGWNICERYHNGDSTGYENKIPANWIQMDYEERIQWYRDQTITSRLAALDDGDVMDANWKENFKEWYYATEEERSDLVSAEQCVEWIEKNIIGNGEDWISVESGELPEFGKRVLVWYYPIHPVMEGQLIGIDYRREYEHLKGSIRNRLEDNKGFAIGTITHFMPLPEPPKP